MQKNKYKSLTRQKKYCN